MPFDTLTTAAVADEAQAHLVGSRIQKIIQPSALSVALSVYGPGGQRWLVLSADPSRARAHLSGDRLAKAFATPSSFIMLLRKYLEGARIAEVGQVPYERILALRCRAGEDEIRLMTEIMGRHSNVILVDESDMVLGAIKHVSLQQSRIRPIAPGRPYTLPPPQGRDERIFSPGPRLQPNDERESLERLLSETPGETSLRSALLGLLPGASPFLIDQIALRAGASVSDAVSSVNIRAVLDAASDLYALYGSHAWQPCTFVDARGRRDFAPFLALGVSDVRTAGSISLAVELTLGVGESRDAMAATRTALLGDIKRAKQAVERKVAALEEGLQASQEAERVMQEGQLVLAYAYSIPPGASELTVPDLEVTIPLDAALSAKENAERLFRRYRKLRDAHRRIPELLGQAEAEAERLHDLEAFAQLAESEGELRELRRDLESGRPERPGKVDKREKRGKPAGPLRFSLDGFTARVGRNARENEEVTFRLARRDDLWFHARQRTGAHVVLHTGGTEPPGKIVEAAAQLAAHFSEGRTDTQVDVDSTQVRNVRKVPGGPPGRVTYQNFRTVRVEPSVEGWQRA